MADYNDLPTLNLEILKPRRMKVHVPGLGIEGPRNGLGQAISLDYGAGGMVSISYECAAFDPEDHEYVNWIDARLSGSFRFMNVPILTDWAGIFPTMVGIKPSPYIGGIPHSDGTLFSDGAGYSQSTVYGEVTADAALNAGILNLSVTGATRALRWSDWFSIQHPLKGWRAYRYWKVISGDVDNPSYSLAIMPPLREAVSTGTLVEFARPLCVSKFPSGFTAPWEIEDFHIARPTFEFIEAF